MDKQNYTTTFTVNQTPKEVFNAIINPGKWWSGEIDGNSNKLGAEFIYTYKNFHRSKQRVTEFIPGEKLVWHVEEAFMSFIKDKGEWKDTDIIFEITEEEGKTKVSFTHQGLTPQYECYDTCSNAWGLIVGGNLRNFIVTGEDQPDAL